MKKLSSSQLTAELLMLNNGFYDEEIRFKYIPKIREKYSINGRFALGCSHGSDICINCLRKMFFLEKFKSKIGGFNFK